MLNSVVPYLRRGPSGAWPQYLYCACWGVRDMNKKMPVDRSENEQEFCRRKPSPISRRSCLHRGEFTHATRLAASRGWACRCGRGRIAGSRSTGGEKEDDQRPAVTNIIVLMTDQERHHMHWPDEWAERNVPSLQRLKRNGLYFERAYTAAEPNAHPREQ